MPKTILPQEAIIMEELDQHRVAEHNDLISSAAQMDAVPLKLFEMAVAAVDSRKEAAGQSVIRIGKEEIFRLLGVAGRNRNQELTKALRKLRDQSSFELTMYEEGKPVEVGIKPVITTRNRQGDAFVSIEFHHDIMPYITELKRDFTQFDLAEVTRMSSRYGISLYKVLVAYFNQYEHYLQRRERNKQQLAEFSDPTVEVSELRRLTQTKHKYAAFKDFERSVLSASVKDINTHTSLVVSYDKVRQGRRVVKVQFHIKRNRAAAKVTTNAKPLKVDLTAVIANRYGALLIANALLDVAKLQADDNLQQAIVNRLFPAYDRFVKGHDFATLQKHVAYVGVHTNGVPENLVPYMLEALNKYEGQLAKAGQLPKQRKPKVIEKLPEWAEKTDAGERTEGPASEAQIQDSLDKLAELRKNRHHD